MHAKRHGLKAEIVMVVLARPGYWLIRGSNEQERCPAHNDSLIGFVFWESPK